MGQEEPISLEKALRFWIEGIEDARITEERLIRNLHKWIKKDAIEQWEIEDVKTGKITDEDIKDLIKVTLIHRRNKLKKREIWRQVIGYFDHKLGYHSKRSQYGYYYKVHHWNIGDISELFELTYLSMPIYPRGRGRVAREYPIEELRKLREQGLSIRKIAKEKGISKSTVHRLLS